MARRYFNWKLAVVILIGGSMLVVTAVGLRKWQKGHKSEEAYEKGLAAFDALEWDEAASNLGKYRAYYPTDIETQYKYATAQLNRRPRSAKNISEAMSAYRTILQVEKDQVKAASNLANIYLQLRTPGEAELILTDFPDLSENAELSTLNAMAMRVQKKYAEAGELLNNIIENHPDYIPAYEAMAQVATESLETVGKPMDYWLDKAVENNKSSAKAYLLRGTYRLRRGDRAGFFADLEKCRELGLTDLGDKLNMARCLYHVNKFEDSEKLIAEIVTEKPRSIEGWKLRVDVVSRSGNREKVLEVVENARKSLEPDEWDFLPTAIEIYLRYNLVEKAQECITALKDRNIQPLTVGRFEAMLTDIQAEPFESIRGWQKVVNQYKKESVTIPSNVRMSLAMSYFRADDSQAGARELNGILADNPAYWQAHLMLARDASERGDYLTAADHARKVLSIMGSNPEAQAIELEATVQLFASSGKTPSVSDLQILKDRIEKLKQIPSMAIKASLIEFELAVGNGDSETAEKIVSKLRVDYPKDTRAAMALADLYVSENKREKAIEVLRQLIKDFPREVKPVRYLASVLAGNNQRQESVEVVKQAITSNDSPARKLDLSLILADLYLKWGQQDDLYKLLEELNSQYPHNMQIKNRLLMTERLNTDLKSAQKVVDQIKAVTGEESWQWRYNQSRLWYLSDDFKKRYTEVVSLVKANLLENPADQRSRLLLAGAYLKAGDVQLALSIYREAYDRSPNDVNVIIPMVSALNMVGQYDRADQIMNKLSARARNNPKLSRMMVDSHIRRGDYSTASDLLKNSFSASSSNNRDKLTLAILEIEQGNYTQAAEMLASLKESVTEPGLHRSVLAAQIQLCLHQNKNQEAIDICSKLVEESSKADSALLRARTYLAIGDKQKALEDFNLAIDRESENAETWLARSNYYASIADKQKAVEDVIKALSLKPGDTYLQAQAIIMMLSYGDSVYSTKASQLLAKSLKENPSDAGLNMIKARLLFGQGTVPAMNQAASILVDVTDVDNSNTQAWTLLSQIALTRQQYDKAARYAQKGLASLPNDRELMLLKARAESGRSPAFAIPTLKTLYDLEPDNVDNAIYLADAYSKSGQTAEAVKLLGGHLERVANETDSLKCRIALARAKYHDGRHEEAEKEFTSLIDNEKVSLIALRAYLILLAESGKFNQSFSKLNSWIDDNPPKSTAAIVVLQSLVKINPSSELVIAPAAASLEKILAQHPDSPDALLAAAVLYQMNGQNRKVIDLYEKLRVIAPDNLRVINNLAWAYCQEGGNYQMALDMANEGLKKNPLYMDLIDTRGFIYSKLGEYEKAIADFKKCIELYPETNPSRLSARIHLAEAYQKAGQKEQAIEELNIIMDKQLKLDPNIRKMKQDELEQAADLLKSLAGRE